MGQMQPIDYTGYARDMYERWGRLLRDDEDIYKLKMHVDVFNKDYTYAVRKEFDGILETIQFLENTPADNVRVPKTYPKPFHLITMEQFFDRFKLDAYTAIYALRTGTISQPLFHQGKLVLAPYSYVAALLDEYNATIIYSDISMRDPDLANYNEKLTLICFEKVSDAVRAKMEMQNFPALHDTEWHDGDWRLANQIR